MTIELVIGILVGIASAAALVVMWRFAEDLRRKVQSACDATEDAAGHSDWSQTGRNPRNPIDAAQRKSLECANQL